MNELRHFITILVTICVGSLAFLIGCVVWLWGYRTAIKDLRPRAPITPDLP